MAVVRNPGRSREVTVPNPSLAVSAAPVAALPGAVSCVMTSSASLGFVLSVRCIPTISAGRPRGERRGQVGGLRGGSVLDQGDGRGRRHEGRVVARLLSGCGRSALPPVLIEPAPAFTAGQTGFDHPAQQRRGRVT